jgi:hypothetical protein
MQTDGKTKPRCGNIPAHAEADRAIDAKVVRKKGDNPLSPAIFRERDSAMLKWRQLSGRESPV